MSNNVLRSFCGLVAACVVSAAGAASAAAIMPDFAGVPDGWTTDRYEPAGFSNVGSIHGRDNVLGIGISPDDGWDGRPGFQSNFYNTQGRQHAVSGGAGSVLSADLYIPEEWGDPQTNGHVRSDMWGVTRDATGAISGYPIIGFTNYGGNARLRVWTGSDAWVNLNVDIDYDNWVSLAISFTGQAFEFFVNGALAHTDQAIFGTTMISAVIMQAYNFDDPSIEGANVQPYTAYWSNSAVPEPATIALMGFGLLCVSFLRRRPSRT